MRSSRPAVPSAYMSSVVTTSSTPIVATVESPVVVPTMSAGGYIELLYSRVPQQPSTSTVGVTGQVPLMSTVQQIPVITAGVTVQQPSVGVNSQQIPVITGGVTVQQPSVGVNSQQIPVTTGGLTVPQPSGLDLQCEAGNMLPIETCKASDDITRNVAHNIKQKIMLGEYVDLSSLLCNTLTNDGRHTISVVQGQLSIQPNQPQTKIVSIEMWTDAFLIFISIYCSAHPSLIQDLLKYMQSVRLGSKRCVGLGWKTYDEQFRLRKAQDPASSWSTIDIELWLLLMQPLGNVQYGAAAPRVMQNYGTVLNCYAFNYNGSCTRQHCTYKHICLRCNGEHPVITCTFYKQMVGNSTQSPAPGNFRRFRGPRFQSTGQSLGGQPQFTFRQPQSNSRFRASTAPMVQRQYTNQN